MTAREARAMAKELIEERGDGPSVTRGEKLAEFVLALTEFVEQTHRGRPLRPIIP